MSLSCTNPWETSSSWSCNHVMVSLAFHMLPTIRVRHCRSDNWIRALGVLCHFRDFTDRTRLPRIPSSAWDPVRARRKASSQVVRSTSFFPFAMRIARKSVELHCELETRASSSGTFFSESIDLVLYATQYYIPLTASLTTGVVFRRIFKRQEQIVKLRYVQL